MSLRGTKQTRSYTDRTDRRRDCHAIARNDIFLFFLIILCIFSFIQKSAAQQPNWAGKYLYEEEPLKNAGGGPMIMEWQFAITSKANKLQGLLDVSGQTTFFQYLTDIVNTPTGINVVFVKQTDGPVYPNSQPKKGDILFTLSKKGNKIITVWGTLSPMLTDKPPKTCNDCFIKH
jgi:Family of unknown function (DUF5991)